jgi:hypothetical protein
MGRFDPIRDFAAIGCVAHIEAPFDLGDAWIFDAARVRTITGPQHGLPHAVPVNAIGADRVPDAADPVDSLGAVMHVKKSVMVDHRGVENIIGFPFRRGIGK